MFSKISIDKLKKNAENKTANSEALEDFYKFIFTNILSAICKNEIDSGNRNVQKIFNKCSPILEKYHFYDMLTFFNYTDDFSMLSDSLEKKALSSLKIENKILKKQQAYDLLSKLELLYQNKIEDELLSQDREESLQTFYTFASILSFINFSHRHWSSDEEIDRNKINMISELLSKTYLENKFILDNFFGEIKKSIEYSIHFILNTNKEFNNNKSPKLEFSKICAYIILLIKVKEFRLTISEIYREHGYIEVSETILLSEHTVTRINSLMKKNINVTYPLNRTESIQIYNLFSNEYGFSPEYLEDYLINYSEKILNTSTYINFIEDKLLILDIKAKTGQSEEQIKKMLYELTLTPMKNQKYYEEAFNPSNRIFRTPLIKIDNYYILSNWILLECTQYFKYRILKNQLSFHINRKIRNEITQNFDEIELEKIDTLIHDNSLIGDTNFSLNKHYLCKHLFQNKKDLPQELDCYIIKDRNLYIMEMKNNDLNRNLKSIKKDINKVSLGNDSYLCKLNNLRKVIEENKSVMTEVFQGEFNSIHFFLAFMNPHYSQGFDFENQVNICLVDDFLNFVEEELCKTSNKP